MGIQYGFRRAASRRRRRPARELRRCGRRLPRSQTRPRTRPSRWRRHHPWSRPTIQGRSRSKGRPGGTSPEDVVTTEPGEVEEEEAGLAGKEVEGMWFGRSQAASTAGLSKTTQRWTGKRRRTRNVSSFSLDVPAWIRPHPSLIDLARVWTVLKWFLRVAVDERSMYPLLELLPEILPSFLTAWPRPSSRFRDVRTRFYGINHG
jgi:hypothetical protein